MRGERRRGGEGRGGGAGRGGSCRSNGSPGRGALRRHLIVPAGAAGGAGPSAAASPAAGPGLVEGGGGAPAARPGPAGAAGDARAERGWRFRRAAPGRPRRRSGSRRGGEGERRGPPARSLGPARGRAAGRLAGGQGRGGARGGGGRGPELPSPLREPRGGRGARPRRGSAVTARRAELRAAGPGPCAALPCEGRRARDWAAGRHGTARHGRRPCGYWGAEQRLLGTGRPARAAALRQSTGGLGVGAAGGGRRPWCPQRRPEIPCLAAVRMSRHEAELPCEYRCLGASGAVGLIQSHGSLRDKSSLRISARRQLSSWAQWVPHLRACPTFPCYHSSDEGAVLEGRSGFLGPKAAFAPCSEFCLSARN